MLSFIERSLSKLNKSKLLLGIVMILINIGSKYVDLRFSKTQEQALRNGLARELIIFATVFMATHDMIISFMLTGTFVILAEYLFNEQSRFCIIPEQLNRIAMIIDTNNDNYISPTEEREAIEILKKAQKQKEKHRQAEFIGYLKNNQ